MIALPELPIEIPEDVEDKLVELQGDVIHEIEQVVQAMETALHDATESMQWVKKKDKWGYNYESYIENAENNLSDCGMASLRDFLGGQHEMVESLYQYIELCRAECHRREHPLKRFVKEGKNGLTNASLI